MDGLFLWKVISTFKVHRQCKCYCHIEVLDCGSQALGGINTHCCENSPVFTHRVETWPSRLVETDLRCSFEDTALGDWYPALVGYSSNHVRWAAPVYPQVPVAVFILTSSDSLASRWGTFQFLTHSQECEYYQIFFFHRYSQPHKD